MTQQQDGSLTTQALKPNSVQWLLDNNKYKNINYKSKSDRILWWWSHRLSIVWKNHSVNLLSCDAAVWDSSWRRTLSWRNLSISSSSTMRSFLSYSKVIVSQDTVYRRNQTEQSLFFPSMIFIICQFQAEHNKCEMLEVPQKSCAFCNGLFLLKLLSLCQDFLFTVIYANSKYSCLELSIEFLMLCSNNNKSSRFYCATIHFQNGCTLIENIQKTNSDIR